ESMNFPQWFISIFSRNVFDCSCRPIIGRWMCSGIIACRAPRKIKTKGPSAPVSRAEERAGPSSAQDVKCLGIDASANESIEASQLQHEISGLSVPKSWNFRLKYVERRRAPARLFQRGIPESKHPVFFREVKDACPNCDVLAVAKLKKHKIKGGPLWAAYVLR